MSSYGCIFIKFIDDYVSRISFVGARALWIIDIIIGYSVYLLNMKFNFCVDSDKDDKI